jgi:TRAP-type C4-dicarboxylate transport system permease small subunit
LLKLQKFERLVCFAAFSVLALVLLADIVLRELLGNGIPWARQLGIFANIVLAMIGMGVASSEGSHLRPRFADSWLPRRWEAFANRLREWVSAAILFGFGIVALQFVSETFALKETATVLHWPLWLVQAVIPLTFFIGSVRHFAFGFFPELRPEHS